MEYCIPAQVFDRYWIMRDQVSETVKQSFDHEAENADAAS